MPTLSNDIDDENTRREPSAVWTVLLAPSSVMLGYIAGRVTYNRDLRAALRRIEESSEPIEITLQAL